MQNYKVKSRYFVNKPLIKNNTINIIDNNYHHLKNVLRATNGDLFSIFNKDYGEFLCKIIEISKNYIKADIIEQINTYKEPKIITTIAFAPLKQDANNFVLEKSTELGANYFINIITDKTVNKPQDLSKNLFKCIQASEQSKRLDTPEVLPFNNLVNFINNHNNVVLWLNEKLIGTTIKDCINNLEKNTNNITLLVGPEGGFSDNEFNFLKNNSKVKPVFLNTNILRAETAIIASLVSLYTSFNLM